MCFHSVLLQPLPEAPSSLDSCWLTVQSRGSEGGGHMVVPLTSFTLSSLPFPSFSHLSLLHSAAVVWVCSLYCDDLLNFTPFSSAVCLLFAPERSPLLKDNLVLQGNSSDVHACLCVVSSSLHKHVLFWGPAEPFLLSPIACLWQVILHVLFLCD